MPYVADYSIGPGERKREYFQAAYSQLDRDRTGFMNLWRSISRGIAPFRSRFFHTTVNTPELRNAAIINSSPIMDAIIWRNGMHHGASSESSPWFKLSLANRRLREKKSVKAWLYEVTELMRAWLSRTNFYDAMPNLYYDGGLYGTGVMGVEKDEENNAFFRNFPVGSYWIGSDSKGRTRMFYRRFQMKVRQIIEDFGVWKDGKLSADNLSQQVQNAYNVGELESWLTVDHIIYPNHEHDPHLLYAKHKKYASCYFESGNGTWGGNYIQSNSPDYDKYLRESGFDWFPLLTFMPEVNGEDSYGTGCPGMHSIGDCNQLQKMESDKLQIVEKMHKPPMNASPSMRNQKLSLLPASINYTNQPPGMQGFAPVMEMKHGASELREEIAAVEARTGQVWFRPMFLTLLSREGIQPLTTEETIQVKMEGYSILEPMLGRLRSGCFNPLIDIVFSMMLADGLIPPAPREIRGQKIAVEYVSILEQSLKASGSAPLRHFIGDVYSMAELTPSALDKLNIDSIVDGFGDTHGVDPIHILDDKEVSAIRQERARERQAEMQMQQAQAMKQRAGAVKDLSQAELTNNSVLSSMAGAGTAQ